MVLVAWSHKNSWSWSAFGAGCYTVTSWGAGSWKMQELLLVKLEPRRCSEKTKSGRKRLSEVSSRIVRWWDFLGKELFDWEKLKAVICLVGCTGFVAVVGWISRLLLQLVVRTQIPRLATWFGGEDADPMLLGEVTDSSLPG